MSSRIAMAAAVLALAGAGSAACAGQGEGGQGENAATYVTGQPSPQPSPQPARWAPCAKPPTEDPDATPRQWECATVKVPLDHAKPDGDSIDLALIRTKAKDQGKRLGSLLFDFGGPGASGVDTLRDSAGDYEALASRYDLVGFDPRGVGRSAPVTCLDDRQKDEANAADSSPDTDAEIQAHSEQARRFVDACKDKSGDILTHVGTVDAAKDMDAIRAALGDDRLNYFGISYGTQLGGVYAHQFPGKVGRMVLDGAADPAVPADQSSLKQIEGFQHALGDFAGAAAENCAKAGRQQCPLGTTKQAMIDDITDLYNSLDAKPLPTKDGRPLTQNLGMRGIGSALYSQGLWSPLLSGLTDAHNGDGSTLLGLADAYLDRDDKGHYTNSADSGNAVSCDDSTQRYTVDQVRALLPTFQKASPIFGPAAAWDLMSCDAWPSKGDPASGEVHAANAAPIVVLGNTGDPATPYEQTRSFAKEIGPSARMLTLEGEGHGAYDSDQCIQNVVNAYLLDGKVPPNDSACTNG